MTENAPTPAELTRRMRELRNDMRHSAHEVALLDLAADLIEQQAAVIEQAPHGERCGLNRYIVADCDCWKSTAPALVLVQVKADAWNEGKRAMTEWKQGQTSPSNPYRIEREAQR